MLGVAYRRHLLAGRAALVLGAVMLAVNLALMWLGPYELSLVGIETQQLKNMTPPSLLLAGHAIMMCAFAIAAAPAIARWARRPRVWWLTAIGNSGAMTLYLWHIPALLFMHLVFDYLGHPRFDAGAAGFIALSILQSDRHGRPRHDGVRRAAPVGEQPTSAVGRRLRGRDGSRSAAVGVLLCVAGAATLASVGWGLKGPGLYCVAVMLAALVGARLLAGDRPVTASAGVRGEYARQHK